MRDKDPMMLTGVVQADETYVGGKPHSHWTEREPIQDETKMSLRPRESASVQREGSRLWND